MPRNARALLTAIALPAFIVSPHLDILAWNPLAAELLGDPAELPTSERNVLMVLFRDDAVLRFADCRDMAIEYAGMLRTAVAADPEHPALSRLSGRSPFAARVSTPCGHVTTYEIASEAERRSGIPASVKSAWNGTRTPSQAAPP